MKIQRHVQDPSLSASALLLLALAACDGGSEKDGPTDTDTHTGETVTTTGQPPSGLPKIWVNEVMAQNATTIQDESGAYPDWVELFNPNADPVDLEGWWLSDDVTDKFKWQIPPGVSIDAGQHLVIFCDGDTADGPLHASFQIGGLKNEDLALFGPNVEDNPLIDALEDMGIQVPDVSLARMPDGGPTWEQDTTPTPEAANE